MSRPLARLLGAAGGAASGLPASPGQRARLLRAQRTYAAGARDAAFSWRSYDDDRDRDAVRHLASGPFLEVLQTVLWLHTVADAAPHLGTPCSWTGDLTVTINWTNIKLIRLGLSYWATH